MTAEKPPDIALTARTWWRALQRTLSNGKPNPRADTGALARLRHCATPLEAMTEPATLDLFHRLRRDNSLARDNPRDLARVAVVAMVLAHVREDASGHKSAIQAVGHPEPKLSPLRFRRLLACRDDDDSACEDLAREMRRFVALAGQTVNVGDLARSLLHWTDRTRAQWAFQYYGAGFAAPASSPDHEPASEDSSS
jgi:CRISPR system Cascade subunit CasB